MKQENQKGFTIIELLIAIIISTIVFFTIGRIIIDTFSFWQRGEEQINLQQETAYAILRMEKCIREASNFTIVSPQEINIYRGTETVKTFWFDSTTNKLMADLGTGSDEIIVNQVENLNFSSISIDVVKITLTLSKDNLSAYLQSIITPRSKF